MGIGFIVGDNDGFGFWGYGLVEDVVWLWYYGDLGLGLMVLMMEMEMEMGNRKSQ